MVLESSFGSSSPSFQINQKVLQTLRPKPFLKPSPPPYFCWHWAHAHFFFIWVLTFWPPFWLSTLLPVWLFWNGNMVIPLQFTSVIEFPEPSLKSNTCWQYIWELFWSYSCLLLRLIPVCLQNLSALALNSLSSFKSSMSFHSPASCIFRCHCLEYIPLCPILKNRTHFSFFAYIFSSVHD